ncbi:hypothetical protein EDB19DRAFT_1823526 [Suillus lakei]|nr:hypothetical protein EDB19DRAFT_1823526 [Suillus lakei]
MPQIQGFCDMPTLSILDNLKDRFDSMIDVDAGASDKGNIFIGCIANFCTNLDRECHVLTNNVGTCLLIHSSCARAMPREKGDYKPTGSGIAQSTDPTISHTLTPFPMIEQEMERHDIRVAYLILGCWVFLGILGVLWLKTSLTKNVADITWKTWKMMDQHEAPVPSEVPEILWSTVPEELTSEKDANEQGITLVPDVKC